jgi:hypothetical protein
LTSSWGVDCWGVDRDARLYAGPRPVVAHPPCQRWGRYWHGSPRKPHQHKLGDDHGCFASALASVRRWSGVLEHPCDSHAWAAHDMVKPVRHQGWTALDQYGGRSCYVEQGWYGHASRKPTWLYAVSRAPLPELNWTKGTQRLHPVALERYGYKRARRMGMNAMVGGKHKTRDREATPLPFRNILIFIAEGA